MRNAIGWVGCIIAALVVGPPICLTGSGVIYPHFIKWLYEPRTAAIVFFVSVLVVVVAWWDEIT